MTDKNHIIRERAYALWETQGRPDGRDHDNWLQAEQEVSGDESDPDGTALAAAAPEGDAFAPTDVDAVDEPTAPTKAKRPRKPRPPTTK